MPEAVPPLFTIAIPTYNRSKFLKRNLDYLHLQKSELDGVEIIVSDNASTDNTTEVVTEFINNGLPINYIRNSENKGPDFNISQCYTSASGDFVLVMGDDDILLEHAVREILSIIKKYKEAGVIYISSLGFKDSLPEDIRVSLPVNYSVFHDIRSYLHRVTYNVTFISGNIVNRSALHHVDIAKGRNTFLIQVPVILTAIKNAPYNVIVNTNLLATQMDNTGGYNLFEIFGKNLSKLSEDIFNGKDKHLAQIISNDAFTRFLPGFVEQLKTNNTFKNSLKEADIRPILGFHTRYNLFVKPLLTLPKPLSSIYYFGIRAYGFARNKVLTQLYKR